MLQVGRSVLAGRSPDRDELQRTVADGCVGIRGELQPPGCDVAPDHFGQPGLVNRHATAMENVDLGSVDIEAQHVVADLGQTCTAHQADVTGTRYRYFHAATSKDRLMRASASSGSAACVIGRPITR